MVISTGVKQNLLTKPKSSEYRARGNILQHNTSYI